MDLRRAALIALGGAAFVYGAAYIDVTLRARSAYHEGEKYLAWDKDPALKRAHFDSIFATKKFKLEAELLGGHLSKPEYEQRVELARFERDERVKESSLKYAYTWFKTVVDLFTPPESKWATLARQKLPEVKAAWRAELISKKIPFEEYMLD